MATIEMKVGGIAGVKKFLREFGSPANRRELHQRMGIQTLNWVDENFRKQGALLGTPWAKLRPSTIVKRRHGFGRGSPQILQDTGRLKTSFVMDFDESKAVVGSPVFYAEYHEQGRFAPWAIKPKNKKALAFTNAKGETVIVRAVRHPGYPQRRMLPRKTDESFMRRIRKTVANFLRSLQTK